MGKTQAQKLIKELKALAKKINAQIKKAKKLAKREKAEEARSYYSQAIKLTRDDLDKLKQKLQVALKRERDAIKLKQKTK